MARKYKFHITPDEYKLLERGFRGGLTHANPVNVSELEQRESIDKNSVYENVLCAAAYPLNEKVVINCGEEV